VAKVTSELTPASVASVLLTITMGVVYIGFNVIWLGLVVYVIAFGNPWA
jgi:hypothetical protein